MINDSDRSFPTKIIKILENQAIKYLILENRKSIGLTKSLNLGLENIDTKYVARLDAGDVCLKNRFLEEIKTMELDSTVGLCACKSDIFSSKGSTWKVLKKSYPKKFNNHKLLIKNYLVHGAIVLRRESLIKAGYYNSNYLLAQDYELYLRFMKISKIKVLDYIGYEKYFYSNSSTVNKSLLSVKNALRAKVEQFEFSSTKQTFLRVLGLIYSLIQLVWCVKNMLGRNIKNGK